MALPSSASPTSLALPEFFVPTPNRAFNRAVEKYGLTTGPCDTPVHQCVLVHPYGLTMLRGLRYAPGELHNQEMAAFEIPEGQGDWLRRSVDVYAINGAGVLLHEVRHTWQGRKIVHGYFMSDERNVTLVGFTASSPNSKHGPSVVHAVEQWLVHQSTPEVFLPRTKRLRTEFDAHDPGFWSAVGAAA